MNSQTSYRKFKKFLGANAPKNINDLRRVKNKNPKRDHYYTISYGVQGYIPCYMNLNEYASLLIDQELAMEQCRKIKFD